MVVKRIFLNLLLVFLTLFFATQIFIFMELNLSTFFSMTSGVLL